MEPQRDIEPLKTRTITVTVDWLWRFFSSVKLALFLILTISCLSLLGTFLSDIDIFHSWWFLTASALLAVNILICTLNRWGKISNSFHVGPVRLKEGFYASGNNHMEITAAHLSHPEAVHILQNILRQHGYRTRIKKDNNNIYIAADKNRYFRLGTFVSHLSLIMFLLAFTLGNYLGFRDVNFSVAEGETRAVGHNTGISIQLVSFTDEYYPDNTPKDYRSEVILYKNRQKISHSVIQVNHPLEYKGIRIYQSFFGTAVQMQVSQQGKILYQGSIPLDNIVGNQDMQRYSGFLDLTSDGLVVRLLTSATNTEDPMIPRGQIAVDIKQNSNQTGFKLLKKGIPLEINGLEYIYQSDTRFSGFQVSHDPTNFLIWVASSLYILGIISAFYFPYRQVWVLFQSQIDGKGRIVIRVGTPRSYNGNSELTNLVNHIQKELDAKASRIS